MRRVTVAAIAIAAMLAVVGVRRMRGGTSGASDATGPSSTTVKTVAARTHAPSVVSETPRPSASDDDSARPQPVPVDPASNPPALDAPHSKAAPPQKPFTRDETITKRESDLKLLDDTRDRLSSDLTAAQKAGDTTAAHDLQIRIDRLAGLRKQRRTELDQIRAGGALPQ